MKTVVQKTDTYWINRYGGSFCNEEAALEDEVRRDSAEWIIKVIGTPHGEISDMSLLYKDVTYVAIDDSKAPFTGQPDGKCTVYLLKDLVRNMQAMIDKHGENVGYTKHHCGMGIDSTEMVLLLPFTGQGKPTTGSLFPPIK